MPLDANRAQAVFLAAVEVADATERAALLDRECGADAELRQRVQALLAAHQDPASILDRPVLRPGAVASAPPETRTIAPPAHRDAVVTTDDDAADKDEGVRLDFLTSSTRPDSLGRLGHYEILEVLGQGGFGIVVRAFDEVLQRVVAIKVLKPTLAATSPARKRFLREARAAAKVRHEHVVQIYAVEEQPIPYLVMEYIPGRTLQKRLDDTGPLEVPEMLRLAVQITRGLAAAHAQGLIHRDIKPGNILLEEAIAPQVKITDFGLARAADDASLTQSGAVAGTPMYMAPEQAEGKSIDQRADLFSLGSVFYVMLSGRPPFRASGTMAVLMRVCADTPRPIREIIPEVPEWLVSIVARLHAKQPEDRFQTAGEVAELLNQHLAHVQQPQQALAPAPIISASPRRAPGLRRGLAAMLTAAMVLLAAGIGTTMYLMRPVSHDVPPEPVGPIQGTDTFFDALKRDNIPRALLALAGGGDPRRAPAELVAMLGDDRFVLPNGGLLGWMAHSPDDKLLAVPCGNDVALFDVHTGALVRTLNGHTSRIIGVAFSPDGRRLASAGIDADPTARVWNVQSGETVAMYTGHSDGVRNVAFSPDGKYVASGGTNSLRMWEADTGKEFMSFLGHRGFTNRIVFSPNGKRIVSVGEDKRVMVWNTTNGRLIADFDEHTSAVHRVALTANGTLMATGGENELILWTVDWNADQYTVIQKHATPAGWLAFAPDGQTVLAANHATPGDTVHTLTRWNLATGERVGPPMALQDKGRWCGCELGADGKALFASRDLPEVPYVRSYDARTGQELFPHQGHAGGVRSVAVSPDGRIVASGGQDSSVKLWKLDQPGAERAPALVRTLAGRYQQRGVMHSVVFSHDGKWLASGSGGGTIALWDVATGTQHKVLRGNSSTHARLAFSPEATGPYGPVLAASGVDGKVRFWRVASGMQVREPIEAHGNRPIREVAFSSDGKLLASGGLDGSVRLWQLPAGELLSEFEFESKTGVGSVALRADGKMLAAGSETQLRVWDISDPSNWIIKLQVSAHNPHCFACAFQPGGSLVATAGHDDKVRFWNLDRNGKEVRTIAGCFGVRIDGIAFSPRGGYLTVAGENGVVAILRVPPP